MLILQLLLVVWLGWGCDGSGSIGRGGSSSAVLELSDRFLEVKEEGHWFVEFYAPWCGHCKRLAPVWEQVAHAAAEDLPEVRVAKLDATRFTSVASELDVHAFPTLKYFRNGIVMEYHGDRSKKALLDFIHKAYGPEVRPIYPQPRYFHEKYMKHLHEGYFVIVNSDTEPSDTHPLSIEFGQVANDLFTKTFFYAVKTSGLPENVTTPERVPEPGVLALSAEGVEEYEGDDDGGLRRWVDCRRHPLMPELSWGNLGDLGAACDRLLVLIVSDLVQRKSGNSGAAKLERLGLETIRRFRDDLWPKFQLAWLDGNEIANNIVLGTMEIPSLLVLNTSSQEYMLPSDSVASMTPDSLHLWLLSAHNGEVPSHGGRGLFQRLHRLFYDVYTTVFMMFSTQPLLSVCLFGLPLGILVIICYTLCSVDMGEETADVYRDSDEDGELDHEKRE